jgi:eukaryotic-like serine/threonine-protein kinase
MPLTLACPEENELLAVAMGEPGLAAVTAHVDGCASCQATLERLQDEVALLRQNHGGETTPPSTEADPTADQNGEPSSIGTTQDWPSANQAGSTDTDQLGPEAVAAARNFAEGQGALPDAIGKYKVVGWLGAGGEADVYRVVHIKLENDLVLKLSRRRVRADNQSGLFDEGKLLVDLQHPNLVRIYDCDFHEDRPFLVMEYVHGRNLEQYAGEEPVTQRRAAALVAKLAAVMAVAHRHGIIHCDIKPRNVLIDKFGEPRLIDFGMARLRHVWTDFAPSSWGGTVAYMAPEQARMEIDRIGPRSDIFALGGVLYFLVTGQAPFPGENQDEVWDRARRCDFEAGTLRAATVPRRLERICLKALAADPADRYETAEAFEKALERYLIRQRVFGVQTAVCSLVLLGSLVFVSVSSRPASAPSQSPQVVIQNARPAPAALAGELILRVWSKGGGAKRGLKIDEPGALPLLPGERVHVEAQLNQPAYVYLLWLDSQGKVTLLSPRDDGKFGSRPSDGSARERMHSPEAVDEGHRMSGPGGLETLLLLASHTPLPPGTDLAGLIGSFPPTPLRDEREFAVRGFDEGQPVEALRIGQHRGIGDEPDKIDDPLLQLMERLSSQRPFDLIKAVRFAYRGE